MKNQISICSLLVHPMFLVMQSRASISENKYSYYGKDGFTRAFKNWSGCLPSEIWKQRQCRVFSKFNFSITVKGGNSMERKIAELPEFNFAGVSKRVPMQFEGVNNEIVKLEQGITQKQMEELHRLQNMAPLEIVNVSYHADAYFMKEEGYLTHMIGVLTTEAEAGEGLEILPMKAGTWTADPAGPARRINNVSTSICF